MKKILNLLGTITLIGTSTTSLVACNTAPQQYTEKELADLKEKNNIKTNDGILEWIAPQEKPFNQVDNKYYFIVWRSDESDWKITKFKNNVKLDIGQTYDINENLYLFNGNFASDLKIDLQVILKNGVPLGWFFNRDNNFLKLVYCWGGDGEPTTPIIDAKTGQIKFGSKKKVEVL